jgi:hypothetical protein
MPANDAMERKTKFRTGTPAVGYTLQGCLESRQLCLPVFVVWRGNACFRQLPGCGFWNIVTRRNGWRDKIS